jgi:NAD(P)-dependent dehydrogenase (short-subunit alcohol dehydrogenase family)
MAAQLLIEEGHEVLLHGRDQARAEEALRAAPGALGAVQGDVARIAQTKALAERVNEAGPFDAVIHNVGIGYRENRKVLTEDGLPHVFAINTLAPYILTCLIKRPARLVYLSSGMCIAARNPTFRTFSGNTGVGTAPRPMLKASSTTQCWLSPFPAIGRMSSRTRSNPAGSQRAWAAPAPPMI